MGADMATVTYEDNLAHMGRHLQVEDFFRFIESDLPGHSEMSSASRVEVYARPRIPYHFTISWPVV